MAEEATAPNEDPLVAALPPATDYITYLTLLEYQLKPQNLSILNRLLSEDSGTLAEEIGWDLLRLVLPMLEQAPEAANDCLDIIARRGNPREVVVRLAEELEKLSQQSLEEDENGQVGAEGDGADDGLPTFPGEAKRIHLGEMKLEGMPEGETLGPTAPDTEEASSDKEPPVDTTQQDQLSFKALMSMLCIVHPRIKTQYPSRFLATSLPAALGAYRRMPTSRAATVSFLDCLRKLSGKQRPPLPPRTSTGNVLTATDGGPAVSAPLPDPEASAEASGGIIMPSFAEKDIITRLLQAVLLEIVDEYMVSLQIHETPSMSWTSRLREKLEPGRVVPGKETETELWQTDEDLKQRDELAITFVSLAEEVKLDFEVEFRAAIAPKSSTAPSAKSDTKDEEPSEYPTSPSQIELVPTALLLLEAARQFAFGPEPRSTELPLKDDLDLVMMYRAFNLLTPLSESPSLPNPAVQDALHVLLYHVSISETKRTPDNESILVELISILTQTFSTNPYAQLRDDAHHIATKLLREHCDPETRLAIITQTLNRFAESSRQDVATSNIPLSTPFTEGMLKAAGVDWLKDEFIRYQTQTTDGNSGIKPAILETDAELSALLFPQVPSIAASSPDAQDKVLLLLPFYISILNLCCVVLSNTSSGGNAALRDKAKALHSDLSPWLEDLLKQSASSEDVKQSLPEIWALDDAHGRLKGILGE